MKRREFIKSTSALASVTLIPSTVWAGFKKGKIRTAHIGVGGMGGADLTSIASHPSVEVTALCDVDADRLASAHLKYPDAKVFSDYRVLFEKMGRKIDAVIVSTPDHSHGPAAMVAMDMGKAVYCQKPLTHLVAEGRVLRKLAEEKTLVSQMGIQIHSFKEYRASVALIQSGIIGKVHTVHAWSPKPWGYDGPAPEGSDPVPDYLDWNLWLGTAPERPYKKKIYHPAQWRKILDFGGGALGDMGCHILDTPFSALDLDLPVSVVSSCREPNGFAHPEKSVTRYEFSGTPYTTESLKCIWYDGEGAPNKHPDLSLPDHKKLPGQGALFVGEKGSLVLPHWKYPELIVDGKFEKLEYPEMEDKDHYHQFIDACLDRDSCSTPFSYASKLSESVLLGVIAHSFPEKVLHFDRETQAFRETEANPWLDKEYRTF